MKLSGQIILALTLACSTAMAKVRVVTTTADLAALVMTVGGDRVEVTNLCEPTQDPHFVDARPHLMLNLNRAQLLVLVGLQLEIGWLPSLLTGARNADILPGTKGYLDTSSLVERKDIPQGEVDRSQGDLHPGGNPHFTRSPVSGLPTAKGIAMRLSLIDPEGASTYRRNYAAFEAKLTTAMERWQRAMAPHKGAPIVGYHQSWIYFTDWLGLTMVGFVEPKPGIPPDPAHVAGLLRTMRDHQVRAILQEEYYPDSTSKLLAQRTGAQLIMGHGGAHIEKGEDYIAYVDRYIEELLRAFQRAKEDRP